MSDKAKTRRGHGSGAVYQIASGKWECLLDLGYVTDPNDPEKKKRKRIKRVRDTQRAAQHALDELKRQHHMGTLNTGKSPRLADYLREWLDQQGPARWKPNTILAHRKSAEHCVNAIGHLRLDQLRAGHVQAMLNDMADTYRRGTITGALAVLRMALKDAARDGLIVRNVATDARLPRHVANPPTAARFMTEDELQRFLSAAADHRDGPAFIVAVMTGLRLGELRGLTWEYSGVDTGTLRVTQQLQDNAGGGWRLTTPKTDTSTRDIPLPAAAIAALKRQKRHQLEDRVLSGGKWDDLGFVFTASNGQPLLRKRLHYALKAILTEAGIDNLRIHDLRHSFASFLIAQGADLLTVRDLCGHRSIQITADVYGHLFPRRKVEAMAAWDALGAVS
jgi:integrase